MRSFTDIRLALATRLGVEEGDEDFWLALPDDDPRAHVHDIYEWVGYLQETLVADGARPLPTASTVSAMRTRRTVGGRDRTAPAYPR